MESVLFFTGVFAVIYIIYWSIQNDGVKEQTRQKGLLRMRAPDWPKGRSN